jgi:hypothetical protein
MIFEFCDEDSKREKRGFTNQNGGGYTNSTVALESICRFNIQELLELGILDARDVLS